MVDFHQARFQTSAASLSQMPADEGVEVAFIGRSNAGKSSAINAITGIGKLARTSKTPGRTQLMNCFELDAHKRLVDLPGYGFAKVPQAVKVRWHHFINDYLSDRACLRGLVLLMDIRHPLKDSDQQMLDWTHCYDIPVLVLLTKADKLKRGAMAAAVLSVKKTLDSPLIQVQPFSALNKTGVEQARAKLLQWFL